MADLPVDPCHDPYDRTYFNEELARIFLPNDNPNLNDLSLNIDNTNANQNNENNSYLFPLPPQSINQISEANDPLEDLVPFNIGEIGSTVPEIDLEGHIQEGINNNFEGYNKDGIINNNMASAYGGGGGGGNVVGVSTWLPEQSLASSCSGLCQILRRIHHTNGEDIMKLEIHGAIGFISHIVFGVQPKQDQSEIFHYQMIDFSDKSIEEVEQYLTYYFNERAQSGFVLMDDPLASFYRALSVGFDDAEQNFPNNEDFQPSSFRQVPPGPAANAMEAGPSTSVRGKATDQSGVSVTEPRRKKKTPLAEQRSRTKEMTLKDISSYFKSPIQEAADNLHLSVTVLKKICRRGGLERWPQRKLNSLLKKIDSLKVKMRSGNAEEKAAVETEIASVEEEIDRLCSGQENNNQEETE